MSRAVLEHLWKQAERLWGPQHGLTRARFGRYVAARGGLITEASAGRPAFSAWLRWHRDHGNPEQAIQALPDLAT